jgi:ParB-like chromosome segregation protein Spo0J
MKILKFSQIRIDGGTQMRVSINQDKVAEYADKMRDDGKFPPLKATFDGTVYWLYDGFHRYFAAQAAGFIEFEVVYKPGTMEDAQDLSYGVNADHGLPPNKKDREKNKNEGWRWF